MHKLECTKIRSCTLNVSIHRQDCSQISIYMSFRTEIECPKSVVIPQNFLWNPNGSQDTLSSHHNFKRDIPILYLKRKGK